MQASPLPTEWGFDAGPGIVVMQFSNPFCDGMFFVQTSMIDEMCEAMQNAKQKAIELQAAQLTVVSSPLLGPDGQPVGPIPESAEVAEQAAKRLQAVDGADAAGTVGEVPQPQEGTDE